MKNVLTRSLAALLAGFELATSAQALTITPRQSSFTVAPGATATAEFDIDFGSDALSFQALSIALDFLPLELSADAEAVLLSFPGGEPQFALGQFFRNNHDGGASITWFASGATLPSVSGAALLSVPFANYAIESLVPLTAHLTVYDAAGDERYAAASVDVFTTSAVPEPQSALLLLAGGCLLIGLRRRAS